MTDHQKKTAARPFFRAFYQGNKLNYALAVLFTLLGVPVSLAVSWLLGELLDAAALGDMGQLARSIQFVAAICVFFAVQNLCVHRATAGFIRRALAQYKALAFRRLSAKSITAFSQENTSRYLSTLTNDVTTIETNYLENSFKLLEGDRKSVV